MPIDKAIGIDNRKFFRGNEQKFFEAAFGIGVEVKSYENFGDKYNSVLDNTFKKCEKIRSFGVYNTHQIKQLFDVNIEQPLHDLFFNDFYKNIMPYVDILHIFYTYFKKSNPPVVKIFGKEGGKEISPISFINTHLHNSYPHICAYKLLCDSHEEFDSSTVFLDDFCGSITPAWNSLVPKKNIRILIKGDSCNYCVSTADLLLQAIDAKITENKASFDEAGLMVSMGDFSKKLKIHYLGKEFLSRMAPYTREIIQKNNFYGPIVFIFDEKNPFIGKGSIENSPIMRKIYKFITEHGASLKYFDKTTDPSLFKNGDFIFPIGSDGEKSVNMFQALGYPMKKLVLEEIPE